MIYVDYNHNVYVRSIETYANAKQVVFERRPQKIIKITRMRLNGHNRNMVISHEDIRKVFETAKLIKCIKNFEKTQIIVKIFNLLSFLT